MANVIIEGVFLSATPPQTKTYEGKESKPAFHVDVYQPEIEDKEKNVQVKVENLELYPTFVQEYAMGSKVSLKCSVNAYQNRAYYKLLEVLE
jgi:hypothetical protein